jgi:hypothetical protein
MFYNYAKETSFGFSIGDDLLILWRERESYSALSNET